MVEHDETKGFGDGIGEKASGIGRTEVAIKLSRPLPNEVAAADEAGRDACTELEPAPLGEMGREDLLLVLPGRVDGGEDGFEASWWQGDFI